MTADELRAKFEATISSIDPKTFRQCFSLETDSNGGYKDEAISGLWNGFLLGRASRDAEVEALRKDVARLRKDADRINWLALHPRGAKITIEGTPQDCIFWGISSAPNNTLREAIDAAMQEKQP